MDESKLIPRLAADMNIIALLDNEPNDVGGMSAEALKAKHDEAGIILKDYINNTLLPAFAGEYGAENVGITTIGGLTGATNTQKALERIVELMQEMTQGAVANESITTAKLAPKAVTAEKIGDGAVGTAQMAAKSVTAEKLADKTITAAQLADKLITALQIANKAVGTAQLADGAVTSTQLGAKCIGAANMDDLSVPARALQASSVETTKIKGGAVNRAKLASDVKMLGFENKTVAVSAWTANTSYADFGFRASVACPGVTASHFAEVVLKPADANSGEFAPVCHTYAGGVYIYAANKPTATLTIPSIIAFPLA